MTTIGRRRRVVIVAFPGIQSLDVVGPLEVFHGADRVATELGRPRGYDVILVSNTGPTVTTSSGLTLTTAPLPAATTRLDTLVLPGGDGARHARRDEALISWIRAIARAVDASRACARAHSWPPKPACSTGGAPPPTGPVRRGSPTSIRRCR